MTLERRKPRREGSKDGNSENGSRTVVRSMVSFIKVALENELCDGEGRARLLLLLVCWASLPACLPSVQGWLDTLPPQCRSSWGARMWQPDSGTRNGRGWTGLGGWAGQLRQGRQCSTKLSILNRGFESWLRKHACFICVCYENAFAISIRSESKILESRCGTSLCAKLTAFWDRGLIL